VAKINAYHYVVYSSSEVSPQTHADLRVLGSLPRAPGLRRALHGLQNIGAYRAEKICVNL